MTVLLLLFLIECVEDGDEASRTHAEKKQVNYLRARVNISVVLDVGVKLTSVSAVSITHLNERKEMDDQEMHDLQIAEAMDRGLDLPSKETVQALLRKKRGSSSAPGQSTAYDPLRQAMADNPGLTYDEAEKMAAALGF